MPAVRPVVTPLPLRTIPNLRHPIAAFVLVILAVILVGVGVLAASGQAALPLPPIKLASCAKPNSALLGPRGARFTVSFPKGRVLGEEAEDIDQCGYVEQVGTVNPQQLNGFNVTAIFGPTTVNGDAYFGYDVTPSWVAQAAVAPVSLNGASGVEDVRCDQQLDWCQGKAAGVARPGEMGGVGWREWGQPSKNRVIPSVIPASGIGGGHVRWS